MTEQRDPGSDGCPDVSVESSLGPTHLSPTRLGPIVANDWAKDWAVTEDRTCAAIALGGNLGNSQKILTEAIAAIDNEPFIRVLARSHFYKTAPIGPPQPDYLNACILIETMLTPRSLLDRLLAIENQFGRVRQVRWGARSLDLDLLLYGNQIVDMPGLSVPHPRLHERAFVLVPLMDIAPDWPHPILSQTISQLLDQLPASGTAAGPAAGVERLAPMPI